MGEKRAFVFREMYNDEATRESLDFSFQTIIKAG